MVRGSMNNLGESSHRKGDGWKGYKGIGSGSEVAWENHGASVEPGSALGPKRHIASTSPRVVGNHARALVRSANNNRTVVKIPSSYSLG